jgi:CubicO group peptidase (beta-lactamase class C family)
MMRLALIAAFLVLTAPGNQQAAELPTCKPESVGLSFPKLDELKLGLQKLVDDGKIPGALALVARHGKIAYVTKVGYRDLASKTPMTDDTIFAIASMTKPITCIAAMMLVEQGKLNLDDPVEKYLPELKNLSVLGDANNDTKDSQATVPIKRPITVRDLFAHTSGFAYGIALPGLAPAGRVAAAYKRGGLTDRSSKTIAELVERLSKVPLAHQPGEGWTYGLSHDVLGRVIEVASGETFDHYLETHIFTPLDMRDTSFLVPESKHTRVATIYRAEDGKPLAAEPKRFGSATFFSGGGGLFSTIRDYTRFAQMLANGGELDGHRIVKRETITAMTTNQIGKFMAFGLFKYGLGFGLLMTPGTNGGEPVLNHYLWGGLYSTNFWVDPRHDLVAVMMTQVLPTNHGDTARVLSRVVDQSIER